MPYLLHIKRFILLIIVCLISNLGFAQNPILFENVWELSSLIVDDTEVTLPNNDEVRLVSLEFFNEPQYNFSTIVCNAAFADLEFNDENSTFTYTTDLGTTLGSCGEADNRDFENKYFSYYENGDNNTYVYTIETASTTTSLTVTNAEGDVAVYNNRRLGIEHEQSLQFQLAVSRNHLKVFSAIVDSNWELNVYNLYGKKVLTRPSLSENLVVDISNLSQGIYIARITHPVGNVIFKRFIKP